MPGTVRVDARVGVSAQPDIAIHLLRAEQGALLDMRAQMRPAP